MSDTLTKITADTRRHVEACKVRRPLAEVGLEVGTELLHREKIASA